MKPVASKCNFLCQKCAKTHLRAFVTLKIFRGLRPRTPTIKRKERRGRTEEGKRWEGRGEGREGRAEKGREGREGREGKGREGEGEGEGGDREKSTPHQKILDPPLISYFNVNSYEASPSDLHHLCGASVYASHQRSCQHEQ
jgi:hypothetical protein